ncbi:hypothetical protein GMORB2_0555 [Geosmithia morbida]|uniref:Uncharacterized protein n=1 Tax=Geosmithia morbida TaxID=1094350 RepID=A0A9P4Z174_9HYPO|nr:uncharacterized protein GMORB2_0555 [Geosmithia morbida]KAF4126818.1 hypothetical protein GMORB2_0555 [Geosmithia morbida]
MTYASPGSVTESIQTGAEAEFPIGMALGSPSQAPLTGPMSRSVSAAGRHAAPPPPPPARAFTTSNNTTPSEESAPQLSTTPPKQKSRKWGIFRSKSRSTKRTRTNTADTDTSLSQTDAQHHPPQTHSTQPSSTASGTTPTRGNTTPAMAPRGDYVTGSSRRGKPSVSRSYTEPVLQGAATQERHVSDHHHHHPSKESQTSMHRPTLAKRAESDRRPLAQNPVRPGVNTYPPQMRRGPLLDVQIPDITMERYSIMFGQVLQNKHSGAHQQKGQDQQQQLEQHEQLHEPPQKQKSSHPSWPQGQLELHFPLQSLPEQKPEQTLHDVHHNTKSGSLTRSSSALLARRQATLSNLALEKAEEKASKKSLPLPLPLPAQVRMEAPPADLAPPRRIGSPSRHQRKSSPQLHLFPPTPKQQPHVGLAVLTPSPRARFHQEAPAVTSLPSRPHPNRRAAQSNPPIGRMPPPVPSPPTSQQQRTPPKPQRLPIQQQPVAEAVCESPVDMHDSPKAATAERSSIDAAIVVTPPPSSSPIMRKKKGSISSIMSSEHITVVKPQVQPQILVQEHDSNGSTDQETAATAAAADRALKEAVEASIIRQISVSREQRQMLGSLRGHMKNGRDAKPKGFGSVAVGQNERLVETKQLTPVMVHPSSEDGSSTSLHMHRRSERVVLEGM